MRMKNPQIMVNLKFNYLDTNYFFKKEQENLLNETPAFSIPFFPPKIEKLTEAEENLSDLEDDEVTKYILSPEESKLKKLLWEVLFKDWIDDQKNKEPKKSKLIAKKRSRRVSRADTIVAKTPIEAIKNNSDKLKNKNLNFKLLESLFQKQ
jgi:hypothetical protein